MVSAPTETWPGRRRQKLFPKRRYFRGVSSVFSASSADSVLRLHSAMRHRQTGGTAGRHLRPSTF